MNSYQTTNAAFVAAGQTAKEGVAHGVSYHAAAQRKFRFRWVEFRREVERQARKALTFNERYGSTQGFFDSFRLFRDDLGRVTFDLETVPSPYADKPGVYTAKVVGYTDEIAASVDRDMARAAYGPGKWNHDDAQRQLASYGKRFPGVTIIDDIQSARSLQDQPPLREPYNEAIARLQKQGTRVAGIEHEYALATALGLPFRDQSEDRKEPKFLVAGYGLHGAYQVLRRRDLKLIATYTGEGAAEQANNALDLLESAA